MLLALLLAAAPDAGVLDVDPAAAAIAKTLNEKYGHVTGPLDGEEDMNGGYRGTIHLVPVLPIKDDRKHLERVAAAMGEYEAFFGAIEKAAGHKPNYRWTGLKLKFFKSVKRKTPAAFANDWTISYNVNGTLNGSDKQVRDLLFHEMFHLNDDDHGNWTAKALGFTHRSIRVKCGMKTECLAPYAPDPLIVRGGTYYSFMPGNEEGEYGADLALRYWREQRAVLAGETVKKPFKCLAPENARVWKALVDEFFAGVDRVPACG